MLTSVESPKVKFFHQLKDKKSRKAEGKYLIEGPHLVDEALKAGLIDRVIYSEKALSSYEGKTLLGKLIAASVKCEEASEKVIRYLSDVETPQGMIASANPRMSDLGSLFETQHPLILVACGIQDPGNLGTIIRTADAAGCSGLIYTQGTVDPYNEKVIRASSGSIFHLNLVKIDDIIELVSALKRRGIKVISSFAQAERSYYEIDYRQASAVLIGNEGQGLPGEIERLSDEAVHIPMVGSTESLNAAVSCAIILYEAFRQRNMNAGKIN